MKKLIKLFLLIVLFQINPLFAEIIKPSINIKPAKVVEIQLSSLMKNDTPYKDQGIMQTWEFAHPNNKRFTGPIENFKEMIKGNQYNMLLNHISHKINEIYQNEEIAVFEVVVLDVNKKYFKFKWQVEKYLNNGPLKNCWLTTVVSQPTRVGEAI